MARTTDDGFSGGLLQLAQANTTGRKPAEPARPAAPVAAGPAVAAAGQPAASLDDIAECAGLLVRMQALAAKPGPTQKICTGHVQQLCKRLEAMLVAAGFSERDRVWESPVRPGGAAVGRFLAP
jgi:hypothetical protein